MERARERERQGGETGNGGRRRRALRGKLQLLWPYGAYGAYGARQAVDTQAHCPVCCNLPTIIILWKKPIMVRPIVPIRVVIPLHSSPTGPAAQKDLLVPTRNLFARRVSLAACSVVPLSARLSVCPSVVPPICDSCWATVTP